MMTGGWATEAEADGGGRVNTEDGERSVQEQRCRLAP